MFSGGLCAAPAYVARHGEPLEPADLARHQCLRFPPGFDDVWELRHAHEMAAQADGDSANGATIDGNTPSPQSRSIRVNGRIASNSLGLNLRLALHGFGIAALPDALAAPLHMRRKAVCKRCCQAGRHAPCRFMHSPPTNCCSPGRRRSSTF